MMSLRALVRTAPRTASRLATITPSIRPAFQSAIRTPISSPLSRIAAFSTTRRWNDEHSQQLAAKLDSEISLETEESNSAAGSDSNVASFRDENPFWEWNDKPGEQDVFLTRKYDDETITVHFSIADFNSQMLPDDEMDSAIGDEDLDGMDVQSGGANTKGSINQGGTSNRNFKIAPEDSIAPADREELSDEEDDQTPAFPVNVNVLIQRPGKGALKFFLVASDGDFMIHQLVQLPQDLNTSSAEELLRSTPETIYSGPPFQQLDEEVQGLLESYLHARGVNNALSTIIPDYIDVKEQKEYLGWLGRVKDFVD